MCFASLILRGIARKVFYVRISMARLLNSGGNLEDASSSLSFFALLTKVLKLSQDEQRHVRLLQDLTTRVKDSPCREKYRFASADAVVCSSVSSQRHAVATVKHEWVE